MDFYLFSVRSITTAQRMQQALERSGIRAEIRRAPAGLSQRGCSYVLRIAAARHEEALTLLKQLGMSPMGIFVYENGSYREVK